MLIGDGTTVERIRFRAYDYEQYRVKDLPLHATQKTIAKGDNYMDFEITMRPTVDSARNAAWGSIQCLFP